MEYRPQDIEKKWQQYWRDNNTYQVTHESAKPKFYILDMFPYPSGAGLHVGHPLGYIASDIFARYKRLKGFNVLHPMGYDSFGLPAEQYAIQTGTHPAITTEKNIARYREQMDNIGFSFDWSREIRTSEPAYYKWTQWIFMQLFNHYYDKIADKALPISDLVKCFNESGNAKVNAVCDEDIPTFSASEWNAMSEKEQQLMLLKYRLTFPEEAYVNWCAALGTVLSNDEIKDGVSERGGYPVERKLMKQWSMRITAYADKLLNGLNEIDWSDSLKEQQRNWIGRSQGASVKFPLATSPNPSKGGENSRNSPPLEGSEEVEVFTTRIDTIYGVSFMVLAPEHELVAKITTEKQRAEVEAYQKWAASRSERDRMSETKKVSGAFTGAYCINPFNEEKVPIYIADYVLAGYGTGAVMAVPSGDQRDWNFAKHFDLPIVQILDAQKYIEYQADNTKEGKYVNSGMINGLDYKEATAKLIAWMEERGIGKGKVQYRLRNAIFSRQRYWGEPVPAFWKDGVPYLIQESELPLVLPEVEKYLPTETGEPPLGRATNWKYQDAYEYELSTMPGWAGSSWYFYRYMDANNDTAMASKEALNYWKDVDLYLGGTEHAVGHLLYSRFWNHFLYDLGIVPEREFAKKLINQGMIQGRSNFVYRAKERFFEEFLWMKVLQPFFETYQPKQLSHNTLDETMTYDFVLENTDLAIEVVSYKQEEKINRKKAMAKADGKRLLILTNEELIADINEPEKVAAKVKNAIESTEKCIISSEKPDFEQLFVSYDLTKKYSDGTFTILHVDVNIVENDILNLAKTKEILQFEKSNFKLNSSGEFICDWEVEKMSKSKFNVVNPDNMVAQYGADCFRLYEMFLGPIEDAKPWSTTGISGTQGFLRKLWSLFFDVEKGKLVLSNDEPTKDEYKILHTCIKKVGEDVERFSFNTCVSAFMICVNDLKKVGCSKSLILKDLVVLVTPFAPHVAEELWRVLGNETSVCDATFPTLNEEYLKVDAITYPISVNGKTRDTMDFAVEATQADIEAAVMANEKIQKHLDGATVKKIIFVKGRMVNIVI
jgi:leucyl-tRNA synthetase